MFKHSWVVRPADIDDMGHTNNVVYLRWVQEVAARHWQAVAPPEWLSGYRWVVLRHEIDYRQPSFAGETLTGMTWVGKATGPRFERFVQIGRGETILAMAKTTWCLLDAVSGKPRRIAPEIEEVLATGSAGLPARGGHSSIG